MKQRMIGSKLLIGKNEWCSFNELKLPAIKAKVDTGAQTSALHAIDIKPFKKDGKEYVSYNVLPIQGNDSIIVPCKSLIVDKRYIMSSNGHKEHRFVIATTLTLGGVSWIAQLTLSNRDPLRFRMLLGREAMEHKVLVDPSVECKQGHLTSKEAIKMYKKSPIKNGK